MCLFFYHIAPEVTVMTIRSAIQQDIPGIIDLLKQVGDVHHQIRPDIFRSDAQKYDEAALLDILKDSDRPVFVAVEEGFVTGYCFCVRKDYRSSTVQTGRVELYIDDLCVDEACRGSGVAAALYRHALGYAKELGCAFLTLNVWCGNDRAMAFYEKMGLRPRNIMLETPLEEEEC